MTTPANPDDLLAFVRAQLDDDERVARESVGKGSPEWSAELDTSGGGTIVSDGNGYRLIKAGGELDLVDGEHIARHDPARVLAEVDAKRRILDAWAAANEIAKEPHGGELVAATRYGIEIAIRALALPYADRPGYREEWRP